MHRQELRRNRELDNMLRGVTCNSRLLMSHMRSRKTGPRTIGSRLREITSCASIPHSAGANSVRRRLETKNRVTA